jgi:hypothetical protein
LSVVEAVVGLHESLNTLVQHVLFFCEGKIHSSTPLLNQNVAWHIGSSAAAKFSMLAHP